MFEPEDVHIHPKAEVHPAAQLGPGTNVWAGAVVEAHVTTGPNCAIGSCAYVGMHTTFGESVRLQHGVFVPRRATFGNRVFIGPNVTFTDDPHPRVNNPFYKALPPTVEDDVSIGAGATILPGVRLGQGCQIGAGAVVTKDVPPYQTWVGNPARPLK